MLFKGGTFFPPFLLYLCSAKERDILEEINDRSLSNLWGE